MWSRLQTAATVEGAMLYGVYGSGFHFVDWERAIVALVGSIFVHLTCAITFSDLADVRVHMDRIRKFEACRPIPKFQSTNPDGLKLRRSCGAFLCCLRLSIWQCYGEFCLVDGFVLSDFGVAPPFEVYRPSASGRIHQRADGVFEFFLRDTDSAVLTPLYATACSRLIPAFKRKGQSPLMPMHVRVRLHAPSPCT